MGDRGTARVRLGEQSSAAENNEKADTVRWKPAGIRVRALEV